MLEPNSAPIEALSRLRAFRQSFNHGDVIDEECGLTADDLEAIIQFIGRDTYNVPAVAKPDINDQEADV